MQTIPLTTGKRKCGLEDCNMAVGIPLEAAVFIATMYVGDGVSAVTKALVPQPKIGTIRIMK